MIEIQNVTKVIRGQTILDHIDLTLDRGHVYGFVGRNGSGKSMLLKSICGFVVPDGGSIRIDGKKLGEDIDFPQDMGLVIEKPAFLPWLSGLDNLRLLAEIRGIVGEDRIREEMRSFGLDPDNKKKVKAYSLGMKQRLGLIQAFMEDPALLILDEPFNGLDRDGVKTVYDRIRERSGPDRLILLCSHIQGDIETLCDTIYEVDSGRVSPGAAT